MLSDPSELRDFAKRYDRTRRACPKIVADMHELLQLNGDDVCMDVGCGTGNYTIPFENEGRIVMGLDISLEMLEVAHTKSRKVLWLHSDALTPPLLDESCNKIWGITFFHYLGERQADFFRRMFNVLCSRGVLLIDTEFGEQRESLWLDKYFPSLLTDPQKRFPRTDVMRSWLEKTGYVNIRFIPYFLSGTSDGVMRVGQHDPSLYFRESIRDGIPAFHRVPAAELTEGLDALRRDIACGAIHHLIKEREDRAEMKGDAGFIFAMRP